MHIYITSWIVYTPELNILLRHENIVVILLFNGRTDPDSLYVRISNSFPHSLHYSIEHVIYLPSLWCNVKPS